MQKIWQWYTSSIGKKGGKISSNDIISSAQQVMVSAHGERSDDDLVLAMATLKRITGRYWSFLSLSIGLLSQSQWPSWNVLRNTLKILPVRGNISCNSLDRERWSHASGDPDYPLRAEYKQQANIGSTQCDKEPITRLQGCQRALTSSQPRLCRNRKTDTTSQPETVTEHRQPTWWNTFVVVWEASQGNNGNGEIPGEYT